MNLNDLFEQLDAFERDVPIETLVDLMKRIELDRSDIDHAVAFDTEHYKRNLLQVGSGYAALILCWRVGQSSPIHDHRGSACGVRVIEGTASEIIYEHNGGGPLQPRRQQIYRTGSVCGSYDTDIHRMFNDDPNGRDLITLHIYTPPLSDIHTWDEQTGEVSTWTDTEVREAMKATA
jgi:cysteine dioxygenase